MNTNEGQSNNKLGPEWYVITETTERPNLLHDDKGALNKTTLLFGSYISLQS